MIISLKKSLNSAQTISIKQEFLKLYNCFQMYFKFF